MLSSISWGLKHKKWRIRIHTYACMAWLVLLVVAVASIIHEKGLNLGNVVTGVFIIILLGLPPLAVLPLLKRREAKMEKSMSVLDPYLVSALEKVKAIEDYFKGRTYVPWSPVITMAHDAALSVLQRMLIDLKGAEGVAMIEQLRREKKLYLSTLAKILREAGVISDEELRVIEILRDLRKRVVHEDYHLSREQAL